MVRRDIMLYLIALCAAGAATLEGNRGVGDRHFVARVPRSKGRAGAHRLSTR